MRPAWDVAASICAFVFLNSRLWSSLTSHRDNLVHRSVSHLLFAEGSQQDRRWRPPAGGAAANPGAKQTRAGAETTFDLSAEWPPLWLFHTQGLWFVCYSTVELVHVIFSCDFRWLLRRADRKGNVHRHEVRRSFRYRDREKKLGGGTFMETLWADGLLYWVITGTTLERTFENLQFVHHKLSLHNPARERNWPIFIISEAMKPLRT